MVIRFERPSQIMLSLWGDMHDLSQILHIPGNDSMYLCIGEGGGCVLQWIYGALVEVCWVL